MQVPSSAHSPSPSLDQLSQGTHAIYRKGQKAGDTFEIRADNTSTWKGRLVVWLSNVSLFKNTDFVRNNLPVTNPEDVLKALNVLSGDKTRDFGGGLDGLAQEYCKLASRTSERMPASSVAQTYRNIKCMAQLESDIREAAMIRLTESFPQGAPQEWKNAQAKLIDFARRTTDIGALAEQPIDNQRCRLLALATVNKWVEENNKSLTEAAFDAFWNAGEATKGPNRAAARDAALSTAARYGINSEEGHKNPKPIPGNTSHEVVVESARNQRASWILGQFGDAGQGYSIQDVIRDVVGTAKDSASLTATALTDRELRKLPMLALRHQTQTSNLMRFLPEPGEKAKTLPQEQVRGAVDLLAPAVFELQYTGTAAERLTAATNRINQLMTDHLRVACTAVQHLSTKGLDPGQLESLQQGVLGQLLATGASNKDRDSSIKKWIDDQLARPASASVHEGESQLEDAYLESLASPATEALFGTQENAVWRTALKAAIDHGYYEPTLTKVAPGLVSRLQTEFRLEARKNKVSIDKLQQEYGLKLHDEFERAGILQKLPDLSPGRVKDLLSTGSAAVVALRELGASKLLPKAEAKARKALQAMAKSLKEASGNPQDWSKQVEPLMNILVSRGAYYNAKRSETDIAHIQTALAVLADPAPRNGSGGTNTLAAIKEAAQRAKKKIESIGQSDAASTQELVTAMRAAIKQRTSPTEASVSAR